MRVTYCYADLGGCGDDENRRGNREQLREFYILQVTLTQGSTEENALGVFIGDRQSLIWNTAIELDTFICC